MEIIEAISDTNIGGAGVLLITRLSSDDQMRKKTAVVLPKGSALVARLADIGVRTVEVDVCADRSFQISAIPKYVRLIRRIRPEIVNCHGSLSFRIAAFLCGVPVRIYTRHCTFPISKWYRSRIVRAIVGTCQCILSNGMIAVANAAKNDLVTMGVPSEKIKVIINGVSGIQRLSESDREKIRESLSIPKDSTVVGIFARVEEYKGHADLIEAASIMLGHSDKYRFLIVGSGSCEERLKQMCREKGIADSVIFTGFVADITPLMNITDINVNCSHGTETSSLSLSEGMSIGIPAVVSNYGGNPYMIEDGVNGYVYPVSDSYRLAQLLEKITDDGQLKKTLSKNARERFERELNAKKMTEATYNYYTQLRSVSLDAP